MKRPVFTCAALLLTACGVTPHDGDDGLDLPDASNGNTDPTQQSNPAPDAGTYCAADSDCPTGQQCMRSTGACVTVGPIDETKDPDAGAVPPCESGDTQSCGVSKLGECRLGTMRCEPIDAGTWRFGVCEGAVLPAPETCNGKDDDCDGLVDEDTTTLDCGLGACARSTPSCIGGAPQTCTPGAPATEICNGRDDDCDGQTDEGLAALSCGVGACARTVAACTMGQAQQCTPGTPRAELCNGADDDCNGVIDENLGSTTCGVGACVRTVQNCVNGTASTCRPGAPATETCNGIDDDCDGTVDDGLGNTSCGVGACRRTVAACTNGAPNTCTPGAAGTEICNGIDDDCDGTVDDGVCGPTGTCPAGRTVSPNTTVTLSTSAASPNGRAITCQWSVVSRPATSSGTFSAATSCASSNYFADVVGTHTLKFTVTDSVGMTTSCTVDVVVNPLGDLWIELTWDRNNDMDLHLQHPSGGNNHNANGWSFSADPWDCYYGNKVPSWDAAGTADDPSLDRDDITGMGPENIRVNTPSTAHDYTIGVHMFSWAASPRTVTATVKVYCGGVLTTTRTRAFSTVDDMWVVGKVRFATSGACTFTYDGFVFNLP